MTLLEIDCVDLLINVGERFERDFRRDEGPHRGRGGRGGGKKSGGVLIWFDLTSKMRMKFPMHQMFLTKFLFKILFILIFIFCISTLFLLAIPLL